MWLFRSYSVPLWIWFLFLAPTSTWLTAQDESAERSESGGNSPIAKGSIEPADVYVRVALVRAELDAIRLEMGRREVRERTFGVSRAEPREVFFQALTLLEKGNRLSFEQTRERILMPEMPKKNIRPGDVYGLVDAALQRIRHVKAKLKIVEQSEEIPRDASKTPSDVFRSIVQANRQLNLLLDQQFGPSDVYQEVTVAIGYTSRLLAQFAGATRIPEPPEFLRGRTTSDVYRRLMTCFERVQSVARLSGVEMLALDVTRENFEEAVSSDVYDIAALLVSELAYLQTRIDPAWPPHKSYYPGRKFPSHVYQRVGVLEAQLIELEKWVKKDPNWLSRQEQ